MARTPKEGNTGNTLLTSAAARHDEVVGGGDVQVKTVTMLWQGKCEYGVEHREVVPEVKMMTLESLGHRC